MAAASSGRQGVQSSTNLPLIMQESQNLPMTQEDDIPELRKQEIGDILQQIMNITDQSLDEAQARLVL